MTGGSTAAAVSDRPLEVRFEGLAGCLRWGSIATTAKRTYTEGNRALQCIRWINPQDAVQAIRATLKQGVKGPAATAAPPEPQTPVKDAA
jgi:hypothetical protein